MTLNEKIVACARNNGYNHRYGDIDLQLIQNEIEVRRPNYTFENGNIYFKDPCHWTIYNGVKHYQFIVTDKKFKQWERNNKINEICK